MNTTHFRRPSSKKSRLVAITALLLVASACGQLQPLTTEQALERLNIASTKLYAADQSLIANLHGEINRDIIKLDDIPVNVRDAAIAIEDERFWRHSGLDARSISRAVVSNIENKSGVQGGSTITQQLAKNIYFAVPERTVKRKLSEAKITVQIEREYDKRRILEMYLNTIYFGRGAYGIQTAARSYFHKDAKDLSLADGAFLAGLIHEPGRYNFSSTDPPMKRKERSEAVTGRRSVVLAKMKSLGMITDEELQGADSEALKIYDPTESNWDHPYFTDMVLRQLGVLRNSRSGLDERFNFLGTTFEERAKNVYRGGLRIYTSLDPSAQAAAEEAVAKILPDKLSRLSASLVAVEPSTGYIRALVGGRDYYPTDCAEDENPDRPVCKLAKVNLALGNYGGGSGRQPGSSFKPIVLASALERGVSLRTTYSGAPFEARYGGGQIWKVRNYEGSSGQVNLVEATVNSVNAAYAHLEVDGVGDGDALLGSRRVADMARRMGINFPSRAQVKAACGKNYNQTGGCTAADDVPAIALGAKEVSPLEMASAYSTFANDGVHMKPEAIVRITDATGKVLYDVNEQSGRATQAMAGKVAWAALGAMTQVVERGTGVKAQLGRQAAGKTGTSQQWRDAWFVGMVPQLTASVWVGNPIPTSSGIEEMTPSNGYPFKVVGGSFPAMIWQYFMSKALADIPAERFPPVPSEFLFATETAPPDVLVPNVLALDRGAAIDALTKEGFSVSETECYAPTVAEGIVVKQTPAGGALSPKGSSVAICISVQTLPAQISPGPDARTPRPINTAEPVDGTVPNVVGESTARAISLIRQAGFVADSRRECDPSNSTEAGRVWKQSPSGGTTARRGSSVSVWSNPAGC